MSRRRGPKPSRLGSLLFALGCLTVLGVTFGAGILAGRKWPHVMPSIGTGAGREARREPKLPERKAPEPSPMLTFYQELTAPLTAPPPPTRSKSPKTAEATPRPAEPAKQASPPAPAVANDTGAVVTELRTVGEPTGHEVNPGAARFTVQVGAFKTREQAEAFRARLAAAGHEAYVADFEGPIGARYRVRVGTYASRDEARHVAERLAAERFATYVTIR